MAKVSSGETGRVLAFLRLNPAGARSGDIATVLYDSDPRTVQRILGRLVETGQLLREGRGRATRYKAAPEESVFRLRVDPASQISFSPAAQRIREYIRQPPGARKPAGYQREFLDEYRPNQSSYLSEDDKGRLEIIGHTSIEFETAGTYARQIFERLLIDLSWNSSRLEGNTYSLLDTRRLLEFGEDLPGHNPQETQMVLNHKEAISFLVGSAAEIGWNRYTLLNLHAMLAHNLLPDPGAEGRLRRIAVGIGQSSFHPLEMPQQIEECFDQVLATAQAIRDPFEQSLFAMVQLPYLQPFEDANKRVSRLAANIPFIKNNLVPMSFVDLPRSAYNEATLAVYELRDVTLLREVFMWTYKRSAERYAAVRQSLGQPDAFRMRYREPIRELIAGIMREKTDRPAAVTHIAQWAADHIDETDRDRFREVVETDLLNLHEGNFARYQVRPAEFSAWQEIWNKDQPEFLREGGRRG